MKRIKKIFKKIKNWFKQVGKEIKDLVYKRKAEVKVFKNSKKAVVLDSNTSYIDWIESIERQIEQTKIDLALGWIDANMYERNMDGFKKTIKNISDSYLTYLKQNNVSIPKELAAQYG